MTQKQINKKQPIKKLRKKIVDGRIKRLYDQLIKATIRLALGLFLASVTAVLCLRFIPPLTSAFMVERYCAGLFTSREYKPIQYRWVSLDNISPKMALAAVAAEDQKFPKHFGFDFSSIVDALEERGEISRIRGASTITQQVAKNLFLWKGRSLIRKGLEAYFTVLIELLWPKQRILEVYLNIAEFGDGTYGAEAAARKYFKKSASRLSERESAVLVAVLPNPIKLRASAPSAYVMQRAKRIEQQMKNLGYAYLKDI